MKQYLAILLSALLAPLVLAQPIEDYQGSKGFDRLNSLIGNWTGKMKMDPNGPETDMSVQYRLVAGGSAIQERAFAGTPKEMVTMYHDKDGKLALTHYSILHNQPAMVLKSANRNSISFDFDPSCSVDAKKEMHMHSLVLTFVDDDTLVQKWTLFDGGKPAGEHPITLKRVKK